MPHSLHSFDLGASRASVCYDEGLQEPRPAAAQEACGTILALMLPRWRGWNQRGHMGPLSAPPALATVPLGDSPTLTPLETWVSGSWCLVEPDPHLLTMWLTFLHFLPSHPSRILFLTLPGCYTV